MEDNSNKFANGFAKGAEVKQEPNYKQQTLNEFKKNNYYRKPGKNYLYSDSDLEKELNQDIGEDGKLAMNSSYHNKAGALKDMKQKYFSIDGGKRYKGYTHGERWNGWATPYFTKDVADNLINKFNENYDSDRLSYNKDKDAYMYVDPEDNDNNEEFAGIDKEIDGTKQRLYPVGAFSWIWDDYDEDEQFEESEDTNEQEQYNVYPTKKNSQDAKIESYIKTLMSFTGATRESAEKEIKDRIAKGELKI